MKQFYFAPLEGISGYIYRNAYETHFGGIDKYFIPFIHPNQKGKLSSREENDILPKHNQGMYAVPQILTNCAEDFIKTVEKLSEYGYQEINLNLGCPSKTVVSKGRGSGFLAEPDRLNEFLDTIFKQIEKRGNTKISVKTRIGKESEEEFDRLLSIYNQYPMEELIIHPRLQVDFYKNIPRYEVFETAVEKSKNRLCYNGDIFSVYDYQKVSERFSTVEHFMLGRGILQNPGLISEIRFGKPLDKKTLKAFYDELYAAYQEVLFGEKTVLFKMKELWFYLAPLFSDCKKYAKKIKKAEKLKVYEAAVEELFQEQELEKKWSNQF